jgi:nucleoside-diphosphate-sugar epimerase
MSARAAALGAAAAGAGLALALAYWRLRRRRHRVVITGGCGNLGVKLCTHLLAAGEVDVTLIEHPQFYCAERVPAGASVVLGDLADGTGSWRAAVPGADTVVHFSAVNPYPNASWGESAASMSHTFNICVAASEAGVRRVVFASSNHVMGGYKDLPDFGFITPDAPPQCGTLLRDAADLAKSGDAVAYAAAKLAGEQLCRALACRAARSTSFVLLRIGWCQPGDNHPSTLSSAGVPPQFQTGGGLGAAAAVKEEDVDDAWFRHMWLSNADFLRYFDAAIRLPLAAGDLRLVNAMSRNTGMRWSLDETRRVLGVDARDDSSRPM